MHIDFADLSLFVNVCDAKSLAGGARKSCISAAAASMRIKALENQIDQRLFYRGSRGVELTPLGYTFLTNARLVLKQLNHLKN